MPTKLIEVALPLDAINAASVREKSIRHGHPSTLHLWWARRPLAAARAVIWASLVDDPSAHPDRFPTVEAQETERKRLFAILENLVKWENSNNEEVLAAAKDEIATSCNVAGGGVIPSLLDPFAGGGAIPLEAQRLGLEAHAHDLNPVAVTINKAMIEIPPRFAAQAPVNPESRKDLATDAAFPGAAGLAADVLHYGKRMREEAFVRIGHLYPTVTLPPEQGGGEATVIAWIWARTVKCPNPICGCEMPLASTFVLSKKKGKEAWIEPIEDGQEFRFVVHHGKCPPEKESIKVGRGGVFTCPRCGGFTSDAYVKQEGRAGKIGTRLLAVVADGKHGRTYVTPDRVQQSCADVPAPDDGPRGEMPRNPRWFSPPAFGMTAFADLFTNRQLTALTTFSDLVGEAQAWAEADAVAAGLPDDHIPLREGGHGARAYAEAIAVYLAFVVDKLTFYHTNLCTWHTSREIISNLFGRQAIPMAWDYAEANPFSGSSGCFENMLEWVYKALLWLPQGTTQGSASQADAQRDCGLRDIIISTDPPYYDNISYADLSDFFYVWLRRALRGIYPELYGTMLTPKVEELIASPLRQEGSQEKAKEFFEDGMLATCRQLWQYAREDIPVTIYYAYKQQESDQSGTASSGWETMLASIIKAGFAITGTWPIRTELTTALKHNVGALASSIVLVCRKRAADAPSTTRRVFLMELRRELGVALAKMQAESIAPVDLAQSAIGPGMAVFSKYAQVLESDGAPMSVRTALLLINQELDLYLNAQGGELDTVSRFCLDLYAQYAFNEIPFGVADTLARAKNVSVAAVAECGAVFASKGAVRLRGRDELPEAKEGEKEPTWVLCQRLTQAMAVGGLKGTAELVATRIASDVERARALAYRLFTLAEQKKWSKEAYDYNALVSAWGEVRTEAEEIRQSRPEQLTMNL